MEKENTYSIKVEPHHGIGEDQDKDDDLAAFESSSPDVRDSGPHTSTLHIRSAQDSLKPLPEEDGCCGGHHHDGEGDGHGHSHGGNSSSSSSTEGR